MADQIKILVVDDEENIRFAVSNILSTDGYQVDTASTGRKAYHRRVYSVTPEHGAAHSAQRIVLTIV